jgi:hypothetical protein
MEFSGISDEALCRVSNWSSDPFLTIALSASGGVVGSPSKSLQTVKVCGLDMTAVYRTITAFLPR